MRAARGPRLPGLLPALPREQAHTPRRYRSRALHARPSCGLRPRPRRPCGTRRRPLRAVGVADRGRQRCLPRAGGSAQARARASTRTRAGTDRPNAERAMVTTTYAVLVLTQVATPIGGRVKV